MLALSVKQPWAWLILHAGKNIENRTWSTQFRGDFYIHTGLGFDLDGYKRMLPFSHLKCQLPKPENYEKGGIVGTANLVDCVSTRNIDIGTFWFKGPYGFVLDDVEKLDFIPCLGKLKFFEPDLPAKQVVF